MKRILLGLLLVSIKANAFDNTYFKGPYAFRFSGLSSIVLANEPRTVATGMLNADGNGHVTGHGSFRSAGITCLGTIIGGYHINQDGTGVLNSILSTTTPGCFNIAFDTAIVLWNGGEVFELANTENDYLIGTLTKQHKSNFKLKDFNGNYAFHFEGPSSVVRASEPQTVGVGLLTADGKGNISGNGNLRSYGVNCPGNFSGNYSVQPDGTGAINTNFYTSHPGCFNTVVDMSMALFQSGNGAEVASYENDSLEGTLNHQ